MRRLFNTHQPGLRLLMALVPGVMNGNRHWFTVDIVDIETIARRTRKHRVTVWRKFLNDPSFPKPVMKLGHSNGYDWPTVEQWLKRKGYMR